MLYVKLFDDQIFPSPWIQFRFAPCIDRLKAPVQSSLVPKSINTKLQNLIFLLRVFCTLYMLFMKDYGSKKGRKRVFNTLF